MHFFSSRTEAGDKIADRLVERYRYEDVSVVALGDGAVLVGVEIAVRLHCVINMLLSSPEKAALEANESAMFNSFGRTPYNAVYSASDLENVDANKYSHAELQKLVHEFEDGGLLGVHLGALLGAYGSTTANWPFVAILLLWLLVLTLPPFVIAV